MSEGEMQLEQSVCVPELPETHVHQPQETGAQASHKHADLLKIHTHKKKLWNKMVSMSWSIQAIGVYKL